MRRNIIRNTECSNGQSDIDLFDVFFKLWAGKLIILGCVAISLMLGVIYLKHSPKKWTSTALITQPGAEQISEFIDVSNLMYQQDAPDIANTQKKFLERLKSSMFALSYNISQNVDGVITFETLTADKSKVVSQSLSQPLDPSLPFKITLSGPGVSGEKIQEALINYINKANQNAIFRLKDDLATAIVARINYLKNELLIQENISNDKKISRVNDIEHALALAKQLNVKTDDYKGTESLSNDAMFMFGADKLEILLRNEKNRPLTFSSEYFSLLQNIKLLEAINVSNLNIDAYDFLMKPSLPINSDGPKKTLVFILAILLGFMLGSGIVLGRDALKNYQN